VLYWAENFILQTVAPVSSVTHMRHWVPPQKLRPLSLSISPEATMASARTSVRPGSSVPSLSMNVWPS
jgi:hypothetical protein